MSEHEDRINSIISEWEREAGIELDAEQFDALGHAIAEQDGDYNIDQLVGDQDDDDWDDAELWDAQPDLEERSQREFERLEKQLGRRLTQREVAATAEGMVDQVQRTGGVDGMQAFTEHYEQKGEPPPDMSNRQQRQAWMTERLQDERAAAAPDDSEREYNLDDKADRVAYMTERYKGVEFEERLSRSP